MFFEEFETLERKIERQQIALEKAKRQQELQNFEIQTFYQDLGIDLELLAKKMQEKHLFSETSWQVIEQARKELGQEESRSLTADERQKKAQERNIPPFSLFCR